MVYQPMLEVLAYLRANGFKTFIVSGGGIEFMRALDRAGLRHPAGAGGRQQHQDQVRGARRKPVLDTSCRRSNFVDDKDGKPVGINLQSAAGRSPPSATPTATSRCCSGPPPGTGQRLGMIVHHDDAVREYAYDRNSSIGRLAEGLDQYQAMGWGLISMKNDWKVIFPPLK